MRDCNLVFSMKPTKGADGGAYANTDQISTCQAVGLLLWETAKTSVGGREILSSYTFDNHIQFIKMQTGDRGDRVTRDR